MPIDLHPELREALLREGMRAVATILWRIENDDQTAPSGVAAIDRPAAPGCASCGMCCKNAPGPFYPSDLGPNPHAKARQLLESGLYSIDWWEEADPSAHVYYLRPATVGHCAEIFDPGTGDRCALLGPKGCSLDRADRPMVCRALPATPDAPFGCQGLTKRDVRDAWVNDSAWLRQLGEEIQVERGTICL